jgi:hypothetical protein
MAAQDPIQDISALAERLRVLPWGEAGVPAPLDEILDTGSRRRVDGGAGRVAFQLLAALGISGWSARLDLQSAVNTIRRTSQANGVYVRAWQALKQAGLYETHTAFFGRRPVAIARLTDLGRTLLAQAGVPVIASEWERTPALHLRFVQVQVSKSAIAGLRRGSKCHIPARSACSCTMRGSSADLCPWRPSRSPR